MKLLKFSGRHLDGNPTSCTGSQIAIVLEAVLAMPDLQNCIWYAGAFECYPATTGYESSTLEEVADLPELVHKLRATGQLLDGVLVAVPSATLPDIIFHNISADGPMNKLVRNSVVEIHAFDTSWVEVYTEIRQVIGTLTNRFGGEIAESEP